MFLGQYIWYALVVAAPWVVSVDICGKPTIPPKVGSGRFPNLIVNGEVARPHSWPWQVQLQVREHPDSDDWKGVCGGTIVTRYHIVTAAHCFEHTKNPENWRVLIGAHNISKSSSDQNFGYVFVINIHEGYSGRAFSNDIAIITLKDLIQFGDDATYVCLSGRDFYAGNRCFVTGWGGSDTYEHISSVDVLHQAEVFIFPFTVCQREYHGILDESMTCAFNKQRTSSACKGDLGGPLVCQNNEEAWVLQGISSFRNSACGKVPSVYTRVPYFLQWINKIIKN